jgi:hypothetical protein
MKTFINTFFYFFFGQALLGGLLMSFVTESISNLTIRPPRGGF